MKGTTFKGEVCRQLDTQTLRSLVCQLFKDSADQPVGEVDLLEHLVGFPELAAGLLAAQAGLLVALVGHPAELAAGLLVEWAGPPVAGTADPPVAEAGLLVAKVDHPVELAVDQVSFGD